MITHTWKIARIRGIELRIDHSWVIIAILVSWTMLARLYVLHPDAKFRLLFPAAVVTAALFFGSVLFHEFTHALAAQAFGIPVKSITLFVFGGATHADVEAKGPGPEMIVSALGPISSIFLSLIFWVAYAVAVVAKASIAASSLGYLAWVNLALAIFNLVPGFPLDGGRVLRAAVWSISGSLDTATKVASRVGETIGYGLIAVGAFSLFGRAIFPGLWMAAIGWFLASSARAHDEERQVRKLLRGVAVEEVMEVSPVTIPGDTTIRQAVDRYLAHTTFDAYPVAVDGKVAGYISLEAIRDIPPEFWERQPVVEIMTPLDENSAVPPHAPMEVVLHRLELGDSGVVVVLDEQGNAVGVVTAQDIGKWIRRRSLLVR
ncbi:MAG: site-2 protease family protein [Acidimicrobiia bacterium]